LIFKATSNEVTCFGFLKILGKGYFRRSNISFQTMARKRRKGNDLTAIKLEINFVKVGLGDAFVYSFPNTMPSFFQGGCIWKVLV